MRKLHDALEENHVGWIYLHMIKKKRMLAHQHQDDMAFFMRPEIPNYFYSLIRDSKVWCLCVILRGVSLDSKMISWKLLLFEIPMIRICVRQKW